MKLITELSRNVQVSSNDSGNLFIEGIFSSAEIQNSNGRKYRKDILDRELNKITEKINGKCLWGELGHPECIFGDNEILTSNGWKYIKDVDINDVVATLNPNTKEIEYHKVNKKIEAPYKGLMYRFKGRQIDMSFTPTHRHLLFNRNDKSMFKTSKEIDECDTRLIRKSYIPKTGVWYGKDFDTILFKGLDKVYPSNFTHNVDIEIDMLTFIKFFGIWLAEGNVSKKFNNGIHITQNEGAKADLIRNILNEFPIEMKWHENNHNGKITFSLYDGRLANFLRPLGICYDKYIPDFIKELSPKYLEELIYWFGIGDGRGFLKEDCKKDIFSTSEKLIDDFHEIAFKCGISARKTVQYCKVDYKFADRIIKAENKSPLYFLKILSTNGIYTDDRFLKIEKEEYDGYVYCIEVQNHNFYVRNENSVSFFTGNSPDINLDKIAIMIESLGWDGDNICGKAKVIDTPMGQIAKTLIREGNLGISSRGLGTVNESDGYVNEDYCLITWDLVGEPSNHPSWIKGVYEGRDFNPPVIVVEPIIDINEAKSQYYKTIWQVLENISKTL